MFKFNHLMVGLSLMTSISCSNLLAQDTWNQGDFSWESYKQTLPDDIIEKENRDKTQKTKDYIEKRHDVSVDRRTLEEIRRDQKSKNLEVSALIRSSHEYVDSNDETQDTSQFGVAITGRFDLLSIGKKLNDVYAEIDVFTDNIWMGLAKRIQSEDRLGAFVDLGTGLVFQMNDTVREEDMYFYTYGRLGWNFEDYTVKLGINVPSDAFTDGFMDKSDVMFSIGWKF